jgi:TolB-like protein/DNA-binding winged helix-turn-helix (wHTH) protein
MELKVMTLLQVLVDRAGILVSRSDLLDQVWGENSGGDESLSRAVSLLRRAFGEVRGGYQYIETVPKRGYRLVANIVVDDLPKPPESVAVGMATAEVQSVAEQAAAVNPPRPLLANPRRLAVLAVILAAAVIVYNFVGGEPTLRNEVGRFAAGFAEPVAGTAVQKSIAVLPFEDLSSAGDQQYLSDGLAEEILNALLKFPDLRVIGRTSSFTFRAAELNLGEINSTLAVSHLLTGSLRKQGNRVRITARLVQTRDGFNLWSDSYDGDMSDIFELQEKIAREIARNLGVVLDLSIGERFVPKLTHSRQAYDLFLQGRALSRKFGHRNKAKARELLGRAVTLDPKFAAAWAWLGQASLYLTLTSPSAQIPGLVVSARHAVDQSLGLDPSLAMGHYVRTILLDYDLDFGQSIDAVEKAYELNPSQPFLAIRRGYYHGLIGRSQEGVKLMERGLLSDPTDSVGLLNIGVAQQALGQLDRATASIRRSDDLGFSPAAGQLCNVLKHQQQAAAAYRCWIDLPQGFRSRYSPLFQGQEWSKLGAAAFLDDPEARQAVTATLDNYFSEEGSRANTYLLQILLMIGGPRRFMRIFESHPYPLNAGAITLIWDDREVHRRLRQHPDFPVFAERIGLVSAWQKYGWPDRCQKVYGTDGSNGQFHCS